MVRADYRIGIAEDQETKENKLDFRTNGWHFTEREVKAEKENALRKEVNKKIQSALRYYRQQQYSNDCKNTKDRNQP